MPPMPCSYIRSTMSLSSCRHSKYADSGWYPASTNVSKPACTNAVRPPHSTTCSPNRSVSVSSSKVVSSTPARDPAGHAPALGVGAAHEVAGPLRGDHGHVDTGRCLHVAEAHVEAVREEHG